MARRYRHEPLTDDFRQKILDWLSAQPQVMCFQGAGWGAHHQDREGMLIGCGVHKHAPSQIDALSTFIDEAKDFVFVQLSYDFKNQLERLHSHLPDRIGFPDVNVFVPRWTFRWKKDEVIIGWPEEEEMPIEQLIDEIKHCKSQEAPGLNFTPTHSGMTKAHYLERLEQLQYHLQRGDIYQANFCQEFYWKGSIINPLGVFLHGYLKNPNPFSVYYRWNELHCLSWSPERFISVAEGEILSQPMKGTAPRGATPAEDEAFKMQLARSEKDRRENVMIVDMVRNDLSHYAETGSVVVPELYRIETYPSVHQMFSTVKAKLKPGQPIFHALTKAFPMASMTGAPKIRAMQIIEELESSRRGLFSGTIGFVDPAGQADFNVIIRSMLYNEQSHEASAHVGGGITAMSDPEAEYEESLTKFSPIEALVHDLNRSSPNFEA